MEPKLAQDRDGQFCPKRATLALIGGTPLSLAMMVIEFVDDACSRAGRNIAWMRKYYGTTPYG